MPNLCMKCGQRATHGGFCPGCGASLESDASMGQGDNQRASGNNAAGSSSVVPERRGTLKLILIAVTGIALVGGLAVGRLTYAGYRAASQAKPMNQEYGLGGLINEVASTEKKEKQSSRQLSTGNGSERDACSFMSKEEVGRVTGTAFSAATLNDDKDVCTYEPAGNDAVTVIVDIKWHGGALAMKMLPKVSDEFGDLNIQRPVRDIGDKALLLGVDEKTQKGLDEASPTLKALTSFATGPLIFRKGEVWVAVTATLAENKAEVQKKVASIVATRI